MYVLKEAVLYFTKKDYEEDFEEMDDSEDEGEIEKEAEQMEKLTPQRKKEIEAIQRAMDEENERVGTAQFRQSTNRAEEEESKRSRGTVIISRFFSHLL